MPVAGRALIVCTETRNRRGRRVPPLPEVRGLAALLVGLCLALTGCTAADRRADAVGAAEIAVVIAPQSWDVAVMAGRIVLIGPDNSFSKLDTAGIDTPRLVWEEAGLAFSDRGQDYVLSSSLRATPRSVAASTQTGIYPGAVNGEFIGVFNAGFVAAGYRFDVTTFGPRGSVTRPLDGMADAIGGCGSSYFAITHPSMAQSRTHRIVALPAGSVAAARPIGRSSDGVTIGGLNYRTPCVNDQLLVLHGDDDARPDRPPTSSPDDDLVPGFLTVADVRSGSLRLIELKGADGHPREFARAAISRPQYAATTISDGYVSWVAGDGVVYRTAVKDGSTRQVRAGLPRAGLDNAIYSFEGDQAFVLTGLGSDGDGIRLVTYRVRDWELVSTRELPGLAEMRTGFGFIQDFAVRPVRRT